jgi:hypothetical protein
MGADRFGMFVCCQFGTVYCRDVLKSGNAARCGRPASTPPAPGGGIASTFAAGLEKVCCPSHSHTAPQPYCAR